MKAGCCIRANMDQVEQVADALRWRQYDPQMTREVELEEPTEVLQT